MINKESNPAISVIVPVYQVAPYLRACLDSIIEQSFTDWEMLLVDDGSTDGGDKICDEYGEKDSRIRVFHQENQGLSAAKNTGIDHARGEYFAFVDSDDMLLSRDYLKLLYEAATDNDAEVSVCDITNLQESDFPYFIDYEPSPALVLTGREIFTDTNLKIVRFSFAHSKIYRRDRFDEVRYPVGKPLEDAYTFHQLIYPCERIAVIDPAMYGYRKREGSIMNSTANADLFRETDLAERECIAFLAEHGDEEAVRCACQRFLGYKLYHYLHAIADGSVDLIPEDIHPSPEEFEKTHGYAYMLHSLRMNDPDSELEETRIYQRHIAEDALRLLQTAVNIASGRAHALNDVSGNIELMEDMAEREKIPVLIHEAVSRINTKDPDEQSHHEQYVRTAMKKSIFSSLHNRQILQKAENNGYLMIPFVPEEIDSLYYKPWFLEPRSLSYLIKKDDLSSLRKIVEGMSFEDVGSDPLEIDRNTDWKYEHSDGTRIRFITGIPFYCFDIYRKYLDELFETLIREHRSMTLMEYTIFLLIKLYPPHLQFTSATLRDLLELIIIINGNPQLAEDPSFKSMIDELSLQKTWREYADLCRRILTYTDIASFTQDDLDLILSIVGTPGFRSTYLKKKSIQLVENDTFLYPRLYTVSEEKRIAYLSNCKAACSSVKYAIAGDKVENDPALMKTIADDNYAIQRFTSLHGMIREELLAEEASFFSFTFVRNPFERLVSCYESKYHSDVEKYKVNFTFGDYLMGYMAKDEGFTTFVRKVCAMPYRLMEEHFKRQYDLIYDEKGNRMCDYIGRFESLEEEFAPIQSKYKLTPLPHLNKTNTSDWMDYYTPETAELVFKTFQKDFISFGYTDSYYRIISHLGQNQNP